jgi:histidine ammonia-lyase
MERVRRCAAFCEHLAEGDTPHYGINTGFGKLARTRIHSAQASDLQHNLIRSHAAALGPLLDDEVVRLMMVLRANSLLAGNSGASEALVLRLLELVNRGVTPCVPAYGSVGASGDLAPLAHMSLALIGEGEVRYRGRAVPAREALAMEGLAPLALRPKEGLALINGTQFTTATAALALIDARSVWESGVAAAALSTEVLLGSFQPARADVQELRPYSGALETARRLRAYSEGSALVESHAGCGRVQDPYSSRCVPQVMGAAWDAMSHVERQIEIELNAVNDNPLVIDGGVVSAGLFHAHPIAMVADYLKIAVSAIANLSERRIDRLLNEAGSGLPAVLAVNPGLESGYMMAQYTAAALASENKVLSHPSSVDTIPTGGGVEDHVSMGPAAARHARAVVENAARTVALELLCGCRALEFRRPLTAGEGCERLYGAIRRRVPAPDGDRPLTDACESIASWVRSPSPRELAEEVLK